MLWDTLFSIVIYPVIFIFPAYVANGAPVIFGRDEVMPIDFGRTLRGKPIFGKHKTIPGLAGGLLSGFLIAGIESMFIPGMLFAGILMTVGTHAGDLLGSFIKRRLGRKEGSKFELMDQYLFLVFALLFSLPFSLGAGIAPNLYGIIFLVILTWVMHKATNKGAHMLRIKKVPW
ncbi:MAG: CDP-archaeol synthase [Candidatus Micrarchaeota archaeon]|nr:CDP-archaeol synthase [Candidatus Micrarchaeota archaeon]